jgi:hypothetical protein
VADAFLDRAPLVALTGQSDIERMHKESHQYIDLIGILRPIVKWNARVSSPEIVPEVVRKAFAGTVLIANGLAGMFLALVIVIGSYLLAQYLRVWRPRRQGRQPARFARRVPDRSADAAVAGPPLTNGFTAA